MSKQVNKTVTKAVVENVAKTREAGEKWTVFMKDAGKGYEELTAKAGANARTIANRMIENTEKNTDAAFKTVVAIAEAGTVAKAAEIQVKFAKEQMQVWNDQAAELFELSFGMFNEFAGSAKAAADASVEQFKAAV